MYLISLTSDMINMIKLDYQPKACSWIYKRGEAEALLAMYFTFFLFSFLFLFPLKMDIENVIISIDRL